MIFSHGKLFVLFADHGCEADAGESEQRGQRE